MCFRRSFGVEIRSTIIALVHESAKQALRNDADLRTAALDSCKISITNGGNVIR